MLWSVKPLAALSLVIAACGGATSSAVDAGHADAPTDAYPTGDGPFVIPDAPSDAPVYLDCLSATGKLGDALKVCQTDSDCVIEQEQTDCCGTILYVGVAKGSVAQFTSCESSWLAHFPPCGCASNSTSTEDGKMTSRGMDAPAAQVHCTDFTMSGGICLTFTP